MPKELVNRVLLSRSGADAKRFKHPQFSSRRRYELLPLKGKNTHHSAFESPKIRRGDLDFPLFRKTVDLFYPGKFLCFLGLKTYQDLKRQSFQGWFSSRLSHIVLTIALFSSSALITNISSSQGPDLYIFERANKLTGPTEVTLRSKHCALATHIDKYISTCPHIPGL